MKAVGNYLRDNAVRLLATPSDYRLGAEMAGQGEVEILEKRRDQIIATAGGGTSGQRRRVVLRAGDDGLTWRCTCTADHEHFCKHCVAVAIAARSHPRRDRSRERVSETREPAPR